MARLSVDELQSRIGAVVDQDQNTANISSTDYSLRLKYINMALSEWQESAEWQSLYKEYNTQTSTVSANASVTLPSDFRKLASFPLVTYDGVNTAAFPDTPPQDAGQYGPNDKRFELLGNPLDTYTMRIYGVNLASGASIKVPYYRSVQSLASPANIAEVPNPDYLVKRTIAYLWEAREDSRFPEMKQESDKILANLIDLENTFSQASTDDRVKTAEETRFGDMRWGE